MTTVEQEAFMTQGREQMTVMARVTDSLESYARTFEIRGGAAALGEYGDETLDMISFWNRLKGFLTPENQAILDRYRTDF
jgi:hypothetical protein